MRRLLLSFCFAGSGGGTGGGEGTGSGGRIFGGGKTDAARPLDFRKVRPQVEHVADCHETGSSTANSALQ
jgi:hypothetical protein